VLDRRGQKPLHIHAHALFRAETERLGGGRIDDQQDAIQVVNAHQAQAVFKQLAVEPQFAGLLCLFRAVSLRQINLIYPAKINVISRTFELNSQA
jgi:hypothetical protein